MSAPDDDSGTGDARFERDAARLLREDPRELDAATLSRLNRARQAALEEYERQKRRPAWLPASGWQPAIGVAAVAAIAVALSVGRVPGNRPAADDALADKAVELEVMLDDENLEMIEDLEFYDWLEADLSSEADPGLSG